jgi:cytochrome P450
MFKAAKDKMSIGRLNPETVFGNLLREQGNKKFAGFTDSEMQFLGGGILDAAVDTTLATLGNILCCLVAHPAEMRRVKEDIDSVCPDKCPQPKDLRNMPYLRACLTEVISHLQYLISAFV